VVVLRVDEIKVEMARAMVRDAVDLSPDPQLPGSRKGGG
jgi:hypothetical protein